MHITSSHFARLVKAETEVAGAVEFHRMTMAGGVMRMREVKELKLPAGKKVELSPGGYHFMLINLKRQLHAGKTITLKLTTLDADNKQQTVEVNAKIK